MGGQAAEQSNLFSHGPSGASCPAGAVLPQAGLSGSPSGYELCSRCSDVGSPERHPRLPLRAVGIRPLRQVQRLDFGGFSGSVCLRNSPRPCESRSHLSGSSCHERGSGALACRRAGRLGRGDVSLINISPSGTRQELLLLRQAYHSLFTRLAHLSPLQYIDPHKPFDLHHKITIRHQPSAFLKTLLPTHEDCMSQHQMSLCLKLLLGLPLPSMLDSSHVCPCGQNQDFHGYHRLNCKQNEGRANRAAHDLVQLALKNELQRQDLRVVDNNIEMRRQFSHLSSQKRGDLAIFSASNFLIFDSVSRQPRSQAIADNKTVSLVNSQGNWTPARSRNKNKIENPGLVQQEQKKNRKHADFPDSSLSSLPPPSLPSSSQSSALSP
jgi:hypothetical protein